MTRKQKGTGRKNQLSDMARINRMTLMGYAMCCIIFATTGVLSYVCFDLRRNIFDPAAYFTLLFLPLIAAYLWYRDEPSSKLMKYILFGFFGIFYAYVLFFGREYLFFLYAIPMLVIANSYYEPVFSIQVGVITLLLNALVATEWFDARRIRIVQTDKFFVVLALTIIIMILDFCSRVLSDIHNQKMQTIDQEKERFKALVSVGIQRIFEYDIIKDELMTAGSENGTYGKEKYIDNLLTVAKQYRYVLYADWNIFDDLIRKSKDGEEFLEQELRLRDEAGDYKWSIVRGKTLFDEEGHPIKVIGTMNDIDEQKRLELRQADENMRDSLTKLYRSSYAKQLIGDFLRKQNCSEYAGFLILDIDNFEILNEKMGQAFGDEILKNIATDIEKIFYPTDILGRIGGDEFIILMKNIRTIGDIEKKIKEIQKVVNRTYIGETMNFGSTVAVGASVFPIDGVDYDILYEKAEKALFHAKAAGKNCYSFYDCEKEQIYSQYHLEEKHEKIRKTEENENTAEESVSDSFIELAFKLIEDSKDTDSAINLLIRQAARQMNLSGICIQSRAGKEYKMTYPYQCNIDDTNEMDENGYVTYTEEQWNALLDEFHQGKGLICISDTREMDNDTQRKIMLAYGIHSCARCAFYDKGEFVGNIDFLDFRKEREWSREEITNIRAVTNVISSYLLKMKAYEDASETVDRLTGYDPLTGFYKYEKFLSLTGEYIETAPHGNYAITYVDFSNFKYINETYGYETGDKILRDYADAVRTYTERFIYGSRVFSDNIVSLIKMEDWSDSEMKARLTKVSGEFTKKIQNEYLDSNLIIDIGICTFEINGSPIPIKNIISNANLARKESKLPGKPTCIIYNEEMGTKLNQEITYNNDMEAAFKNHEFVVYLQPKVNLKSNQIDGAEALIRWRKSDGTLIFPNDFIPVFEKNKTITLLDYYVYAEVCKYLAGRLERQESVVCISMNVSRVHLFSIRPMVGYIKGLLKKYKVPPQLLEFELTETVFTDKVDDTILLMEELQKLGVKVSMDDFGSGYSSLNVLTKLPLDALKLDKEFLKDFTDDSEEKIIIPSIIDMAKKLKLSVVCEGVETLEQVDFLKEVGCDYAQGFYYSKPIPIPQFDDLLKAEL